MSQTRNHGTKDGDVSPILEQRCDVCHSCYDAPCQLKLTSFDGLERGGSKKLVYDAARLSAERPTRLFIDADSVKEWREMDFQPVLNEREQTPEANLENSVLNLMLELKKEYPLPETDLLPQVFDLRLSRDYIYAPPLCKTRLGGGDQTQCRARRSTGNSHQHQPGSGQGGDSGGPARRSNSASCWPAPTWWRWTRPPAG